MPTKAIEQFQKIFFWSSGVVALLSVLLGWYYEAYYIFGVPFFILFCYLTIVDFKVIFYLLIALIPISIEYSFNSSFGTDLPTEPIIVGLMLVFFGYVVSRRQPIDRDFFTHPIITILLLHVIWMVVTIIYSSMVVISLKFVIAKIWYVAVFTFMGGIVIKDHRNFKIAFWCLFPGLVFTICYTLIRHSEFQFSFASVNTMMTPFFRNHVVYAATVALAVPFVWWAAMSYKRGSFKRNILFLFMLLFIAAVFLSYTRSSWLSLIVALLFVFVIRYRLTKLAIIFSSVALVTFIGYLASKNHYLDYAPTYEHTIMHEELNDHLEATYEMEDISSEERVYRWIAGFRMSEASPITGYGPGNFYNFYKPYTVSRFRTYVSANPERSTVHNYFLLTLVEQGLIGLIIFYALTVMLLINGERIYHETKDKLARRWILAVLLSMIIIYVNTFLSDLLEVDKTGTFFFLFIALLVNQDLRNKRERAGLPEPV